MVVAPDKPPFYRVAMINGINSRPVRICRSDHVALWAQDHGRAGVCQHAALDAAAGPPYRTRLRSLVVKAFTARRGRHARLL